MDLDMFMGILTTEQRELIEHEILKETEWIKNLIDEKDIPLYIDLVSKHATNRRRLDELKRIIDGDPNPSEELLKEWKELCKLTQLKN